MNATVGQGQVIVRILLALCVVLLAGFWGLIVLFSDFPPHWSYARWTLYVLSGHVLAGLIIGMLLPLRWRLSIAAAWGAILINVVGLVGMLRSGESNTGPPVSFFARFAFPVLTLFVVPAAVALGGYAGSRVVRRWSRNSASSHGTGNASKAS
jgi:hypothetical protein